LTRGLLRQIVSDGEGFLEAPRPWRAGKAA